VPRRPVTRRPRSPPSSGVGPDWPPMRRLSMRTGASRCSVADEPTHIEPGAGDAPDHGADQRAKDERRWLASRACERRLSGDRPLTIGERLARLTRAPVDLDTRADMYGDGIVTQLEERVAHLLGKPAAVFFPT